jgi:hypothetical protein
VNNYHPHIQKSGIVETDSNGEDDKDSEDGNSDDSEYNLPIFPRSLMEPMEITRQSHRMRKPVDRFL